MRTEEEYEDVMNRTRRIEDMLIVLLSETTFVDGDLVAAARKRLINDLILTA